MANHPEQEIELLVEAGLYGEAAEQARIFAERGEAWAQGALGSYYQCGLGVTFDPALAEFWLVKAVAGGDVLACHNLATLYVVHFSRPDLAIPLRAEVRKRGMNPPVCDPPI